MLTIYLDMESIKSRNLELINFNDKAFDGSITDEFIKSNEDYIKKIDESEYLGNLRMKSKFTDTVVSIDKLSTGCKTLYNILLNADNNKIVVNTIECGYNVIHEIMLLEKGNVYTPILGITSLPKAVKIVKNNEEYIVSDISKLAELLKGEDDEHWAGSNIRLKI